MINGLSMFSCSGFAEQLLNDCGIKIKVANELIKKRAQLYSYFYPETHMINGDITSSGTFEHVKRLTQQFNCKFLIATPPCQGMSIAGKKDYYNDKRNFLIFKVLDMIDQCDFDYIMIENVKKFLKLKYPYKETQKEIVEILNGKYQDRYNIDAQIFNAKDYGIPQSRERAIIRLWKKGLSWKLPTKQKEITLNEAIGNLPSLNPGEDSGIKWHKAILTNLNAGAGLRNTPTGSAVQDNPNNVLYNSKGKPLVVQHSFSHFKRQRWDRPGYTITTKNYDAHACNTCHPGRLLPDGTYSDPRVLTLRELFIIDSINPDINLPNWATETFVRIVLGEAIPPKLVYEIVKNIEV